MIGSIGFNEILVIVLLIGLVFGFNKIPDITKKIMSGIKTVTGKNKRV